MMRTIALPAPRSCVADYGDRHWHSAERNQPTGDCGRWRVA